MGQSRPHPFTVLAATVVCGLGVTACDTTRNDPPPAPSPAHSRPSNLVLGETVTVTGIVIRVLSETSFVVDVSAIGDQPLLVLCAPGREVTVNYRVTVTGRVEQFTHERYVDDYALAPDERRYRRFSAERVLVSSRAPTVG